MSWQNEMIPMLRIIISDNCDPYTYSDSRLEEVLIVGAMYVNQEINKFGSYTISVNNKTISPNPISNPSFVNMTVLKAACIVDQSTFRTEALRAGISAKCGPAVLNTVSRLDGFSELLNKGPCASYERLKDDLNFGSGSIARFILGPFISNEFDPATLPMYNSDNKRGLR